MVAQSGVTGLKYLAPPPRTEVMGRSSEDKRKEGTFFMESDDTGTEMGMSQWHHESEAVRAGKVSDTKQPHCPGN